MEKTASGVQKRQRHVSNAAWEATVRHVPGCDIAGAQEMLERECERRGICLFTVDEVEAMEREIATLHKRDAYTMSEGERDNADNAEGRRRRGETINALRAEVERLTTVAQVNKAMYEATIESLRTDNERLRGGRDGQADSNCGRTGITGGDSGGGIAASSRNLVRVGIDLNPRLGLGLEARG